VEATSNKLRWLLKAFLNQVKPTVYAVKKLSATERFVVREGGRLALVGRHGEKASTSCAARMKNRIQYR
jgi:hypothetical protein